MVEKMVGEMVEMMVALKVAMLVVVQMLSEYESLLWVWQLVEEMAEKMVA